MAVKHFRDGDRVARALLVREAEPARGPDGGDYLRVLLGDRTGCVEATVGQDVANTPELELCRPGAVIWVEGCVEEHHRHGPLLRIGHLRHAKHGEYERDELLDGPPRSAELMEADLRELVATVQNAHLRTLLDAVLGEKTQTWTAYRRAPAAKRYHQAYEHGLLEHSLTVAQGVSAISATFPGIDRDVAVTGALLHDIGKLDAYALDAGDGEITMSDLGRLFGEIPLGYYLVRRAIEELSGFPDELAQAVLHIILSHHGSLQHGSPVVPCTREATLVHMIDNLGGRLGSFDRLEKDLPAGEQWSSYDKALGGGAFFAAPSEPRARRAA